MTTLRSPFAIFGMSSMFLAFSAMSGAACTDSATSNGAALDAGATTDAGTDEASATTFLPSNFDPSTIDMSLASDVDVNGQNGGCILDTDNPSTFTCNNQDVPFAIAVKQVAQPNGPQLLVVGVKSFRVEEGVTLAIGGSHPLAIYSLGPVTIAGTIQAAASGSTEGNGSSHDNGPGQPGDAADDSHVGSAGASFCGKGGAGAPVGTGAAFGTSPVAPYGDPTLIPLLGGSAGGHHASTGYGGGAVQITSLVSIGIFGEINASGDSGGQGDSSVGGAGGGSGGAILLEAPAVTGAGKLFANGGGGGSLTDPGSDGQESAQAAPGGGQTGGAGAAGATVDGAPGSSLASDNGGGGGGAGYIRINSATATSGFTGTASPSLSTACGTQGPLRR